MHLRPWLLLASSACAFLLALPPASAFFGAFSKLAEDMKKLEQSDPSQLDGTLREMESVFFRDVHSADWFHRYVVALARWNIVAGKKDAAGQSTGEFAPQNEVTVAEVLKMTLKAAQVDETTCTGKPALKQAEQHWARPFVLCTQERNVALLASKPDLNRSATRAEVLSVLFDAFGDDVPPLFSTFSDTAGHPLEPDIAYGAALRIVSGDKGADGKPTGIFRPNDPVKRGEAAKIIYERLRVQILGKRTEEQESAQGSVRSARSSAPRSSARRR